MAVTSGLKLLLRAATCGQWVPSSNSLAGMQQLHSVAASCCAAFNQQSWRPVSTSASSSAQAKQQQKPAASTPPAAPAADAQQQHGAHEAAVQQLAQHYQRSRMRDFYNVHLSRELMLKLNVRSAQQLPRLKDIVLSVNAKDLHGKRYVEKWEMLLPALALEYVTGTPAEFVYSTVKYYRSRNAVTSVKVRLTGRDAYDLLQKLVYVLLPSQNGFSGITSRSFDKAGNLHFRVPRMVNFPDFEEQFEIFENLGSLHVSINLANVSRAPARAQLLLTGLQMPILSKVKGSAAAAADGQEAEEGESSSEEESEESEDEE